MKKIIALCTAFTLLILACCVVPISSAQEVISDSETLQPEYTNKLNKIHFYFPVENKNENSVATMSTPEKNAEVPQFAYIDNKAELGKAINNMNSYCESVENEDKPINVTVEFKSGFENTEEYAAFQEEKQTLKTLEEVRDYKRRLAAFSKEFHRRENENNVKKLNGWNYENLEIIDYCPFVVFEMDKNDISSTDLLKLANDRKISNVSLSLNNNEKIENHEISWDRALKEIEAFDMVMVGNYSGRGIKIGILEKGVCYPDNEYLSNRTIHFDPTSTYDNKDNIRDHATKVTTIIARMAKNAELYVSNNYGRQLAWFIDQGCDIVNCSYGYNRTELNDQGTYDFVFDKAIYNYAIDGEFDYQIKANDINVVVSAGNVYPNNSSERYNPDGYITSPGLANNAITVGGLDCKLGFFDYELTHSNSSNYKTVENFIKPEISAINTFKLPGYDSPLSGTSFAAPQVTASLAIMFQKYPALATMPSCAKAALLASANKTENFNDISGSNFDPKVGSGCLSLDDLLNCECTTYVISDHESNMPEHYRIGNTLSVKKNDVIQASVTWPVTVNRVITSLDRYVTNYDIHIYNSSGELVYTSALGDFSNSEFLRYKVTKAGDYRVAIYQKSAMPSQITSELVGLSMCVK